VIYNCASVARHGEQPVPSRARAKRHSFWAAIRHEYGYLNGVQNRYFSAPCPERADDQGGHARCGRLGGRAAVRGQVRPA
jgi:hypothetical protein